MDADVMMIRWNHVCERVNDRVITIKLARLLMVMAGGLVRLVLRVTQTHPIEGIVALVFDNVVEAFAKELQSVPIGDNHELRNIRICVKPVIRRR
ncbi:hypothetical protein KPH14_003069 [Odynerus spinipes]|uniref:Uncharacterized protein n=1 Tax=Odynerus spinipes TaxID=1348599 RepID=A0AAD9RWR5_9HYME|nr:hypothetical protein KPH14_003069 [Odynerus spinipes]